MILEYKMHMTAGGMKPLSGSKMVGTGVNQITLLLVGHQTKLIENTIFQIR